MEKLLQKKGLQRLRTVALATVLLGFCAGAKALPIDGIQQAGEYSSSKSVQWYNSHQSIYTIGAGLTTSLFYQNNGSTLSLFIEVPTFARRMIWESGVDFTAGTDCIANPSECGDIPQEFLDAYAAGTHHNSVNMDYNTQTGSEHFVLEGTGALSMFANDLCFGLQDDGGNCSNPLINPDVNDSDLYWQTSLDYVLDNNLCTITKCLEFQRTMSIELEFRGLAAGEADDILNSITRMELHMSDEARGIPSAVPVPAAVWLSSSALLGLVGFKRSKAQK
jgi:hypothetical protein